jgi:hypothetical protein
MRPVLFLAGLAFLLSGAAALLYQVAWQPILALHTGVGIESVAIIVAAFMAGPGLGSSAGGLLSPRLRPRTALSPSPPWSNHDLFPRDEFNVP